MPLAQARAHLRRLRRLDRGAGQRATELHRPVPWPVGALDRLAAADGATSARGLISLQQTHGNQVVQRLLAGLTRPSGEESAGLADRLRASAGRGQPLAPAVQVRLEAGLGADLDGVRLHTDAEANQLAVTLNASAFTTGADIYFRDGVYDPDSAEGLRVLAHEAAHAVQQAVGPVAGTPVAGGIAVSEPGDPFERAAEQAADAIVGGWSAAPATTTAATSMSGSAPAVQRWLDEYLPDLGLDGLSETLGSSPWLMDTAPVSRPNAPVSFPGDVPTSTPTTDPDPLDIDPNRDPNYWNPIRPSFEWGDGWQEGWGWGPRIGIGLPPEKKIGPITGPNYNFQAGLLGKPGSRRIGAKMDAQSANYSSDDSGGWGWELGMGTASMENSYGEDGFTAGGGANLGQIAVRAGTFDPKRQDDGFLRFGVSRGPGLQLRGHWGDQDKDGAREYGFGADIGPVTFDFKTESLVGLWKRLWD